MAQQATSDNGADDNDARTPVLQFHFGGGEETLDVDVSEPMEV